MKLQLIMIFVFILHFSIAGQHTLLYDLDSYKRVTGEYRTTFLIPDANFDFNNVINDPTQTKKYHIGLGGNYRDSQIYNDEKNQKTIFKQLGFDLISGTDRRVALNFGYNCDNRSYKDLKFFKNGLNINSNNLHRKIENQFSELTISTNISFDLGFGFGRLEVINNAWLGARILEELDSKNLLRKIPTANRMKMFFDFIGDLEFERVMDNRLRSMYRREQIISFIEEEEWIDKGSISAFVTIIDALLYESFIFRQSGERLEFTLTPAVNTNLTWVPILLGFGDNTSTFIQPGFYGTTEYEIHRNGDLQYYTTKLVGGRIGYFESVVNDPFQDSKIISGELYFNYSYRYIPSLRTNLQVSSNVSAGFVYTEVYNAILSASTIVEYNYYFSPATRLVLTGRIFYNDLNFQIGDYNPSIQANFSIFVVHAIR